MDAFESALAHFRLESREFSALCAFQAPWGVTLDTWPCFQFHAVRSGSCWIRIGGRAPVRLGPGDLVLLPHGSRHDMLSDPSQAGDAAGMARLLATNSSGDWTVEIAGGGETSRLICAGFACAAASKGPVLSCLPDLIHLRAGETASLEPLLALAEVEFSAEQPGSAAMILRVAELVLVEAVRSYARTLGPGESGWLAALGDKRIATVLRLIHAEPARRWTLSMLAARAGVSRSLLASRFRALVGVPVHAYVTRLRVLMAADLLRGADRLSVSVVAEEVGYSSEAVFVRAFRRIMDLTPSTFRSRSLQSRAGPDCAASGRPSKA